MEKITQTTVYHAIIDNYIDTQTEIVSKINNSKTHTKKDIALALGVARNTLYKKMKKLDFTATELKQLLNLLSEKYVG